jgi:ParB/RepB/Spo0J family partition protein
VSLEIETEDFPGTISLMISVDAIVRGGYNPNGRIEGPEYDEFREDVRKRGVLQAVLVRPATDAEKRGLLNAMSVRLETDAEKPEGDAYFLIAGHRRVQAAIDTMIDRIPAVVIASDPKSDDELRLIENIHRADLDPLVEAEVYSAMIKTFGADGPEEIATRVGKPAGHVRRRLDLLRVSKKVLDAVRAGELQLRVAELVGSISNDKLRASACEEAIGSRWNGPVSVAVMRRWIAQNAGRALSDAPWDVTDEQLYQGDPCKGSCRHCPFNTQNQGELFGDVGKEAACMNAAGWAAKSKAFFDKRSAEVKAAGGAVLSSVEAKALARGKSAGRYAEVRAICHQDSRYRTFGELAGKDLGVRAIGFADGEIVEAVDGKAVLASAKERGIKLSSPHPSSARHSVAEKKQRANSQRVRSTVAIAMEKIVEKAEHVALSPKWVLEQLTREASSEQARTLCIRRGWVPEKKEAKGMGGWSPRDVVQKRGFELTDSQAQGAIVEILATPPYPGNTTGIESACSQYGVSWAKLLESAEKGGSERKAAKKGTTAKAKRTKRVPRKTLIKKRAKKGRRR